MVEVGFVGGECGCEELLGFAVEEFAKVHASVIV